MQHKILGFEQIPTTRAACARTYASGQAPPGTYTIAGGWSEGASARSAAFTLN